jgi:hypothetical protein
MAILQLNVGVDIRGPWLELINDLPEPVGVRRIMFGPGSGGALASLGFVPALQIGPGGSWRSGDPLESHTRPEYNPGRDSLNQPIHAPSEWLEEGLSAFLQGRAEEVIRIPRIDLDPPHAGPDQPDPAFYVVRADKGRITEFFPLQGWLQGTPSLLDALLESRRHGT